MKYNVYFEIYGKKMKAQIEASSKGDAMQILHGKLIIHKIELTDDLPDDFNIFKDIFKH